MRSLLACLYLLCVSAALSQLKVPDRPAGAVGGNDFAQQIANLDPEKREARIYEEVVRGNVPQFERNFVPVEMAARIDGRIVNARIFVLPDYLAVGSDADYFYVPMTPFTAQRITDRLHCTLPTPPMVDAIYFTATVKLEPSPIPPSPEMTTVPVFLQHSQTVVLQRAALLEKFPWGSLTAGDKKDIVICRSVADHPDRVAIYGWHKLDGKPIQPLYIGHLASWADYSHGVRLIDQTMEVDGKKMAVSDVLRDTKLSSLLSREGEIRTDRYEIHSFPKAPPPANKPVTTNP